MLNVMKVFVMKMLSAAEEKDIFVITVSQVNVIWLRGLQACSREP